MCQLSHETFVFSSVLGRFVNKRSVVINLWLFLFFLEVCSVANHPGEYGLNISCSSTVTMLHVQISMQEVQRSEVWVCTNVLHQERHFEQSQLAACYPQ